MLHLHLLCRDLLHWNAVRMSHAWTMLQPVDSGFFFELGCCEWPWIAALLASALRMEQPACPLQISREKEGKTMERKTWEDWITRTVYEENVSKPVSRPKSLEHAVVLSPHIPVAHQDCKTKGPGPTNIETTYSYCCSSLLRVLCVVLCFLQIVWVYKPSH